MNHITVYAINIPDRHFIGFTVIWLSLKMRAGRW